MTRPRKPQAPRAVRAAGHVPGAAAPDPAKPRGGKTPAPTPKPRVVIRPVALSDRAFWLSLDRHLPARALARKVRAREGYVLTVGGRPAGLLRWGWFWDEIPFCNLLFVAPGARGRGYGARLLRHWEQRMRAAGADLALTSTQADETAQNFYRHLGYRDCGAFLLPAAPATELLLVKAL